MSTPLLHSRVALVTGGARGIGRAVVQALAEAGARVAFTYHQSQDLARNLQQELTQAGTTAEAIACDVRDAESVKQTVETVLARFSQIDILVNNAGILREQMLAFTKEAEWDEVVDTNLKGAFLFTKAAVRPMTRQRYGRIINVASDAGRMGDAQRSSYCASKAGLLGLTRAVARETALQGITVNAVSPGIIETDLLAGLPDAKLKAYVERIPLRRFGTAREVADLVVFLASEKAAYITGQVISVDGGLYM